MSLYTDGSDYLNAADDKAEAYRKDQPGLMDVFFSSVQGTVDEDLTTSRFMNQIDPDSRNREIRKLVDDGVISQAELAANTTQRFGMGTNVDYNALAKLANESYGASIETDTDLKAKRDEFLAVRRQKRESIYSEVSEDSPIATFITQMTGSVLASLTDPTNLAFAFVPMAYGIKGLSRAAYTAAMTRKGVITGTATAASVEPFIYAWKQEIGADPTLKDALFNIGASGLLDGALSGIGGNIKHRLTGKNVERPAHMTDEEYRDTLSGDFREAGFDEDEADELANTVMEFEDAPDPDMQPEEFTQIIEETQERMDVGGHTDVAPEHDIDDMPEYDNGDMPTDDVDGEFDADDPIGDFDDPDFDQEFPDESPFTDGEDLDLIESFQDGDGNEIRFDDFDADIDEHMNSLEAFTECMI